MLSLYSLLTVLAAFAATANGNGRSLAAEFLPGQNFTLSNGDTVMCVLLGNQPSLVGVKNPKVQLKPSAQFVTKEKQGLSFQLFEEESHTCKKGTIPVLVSQKSVMKPKQASFSPASSPAIVHEFSTAHLTGSFSGMQTTLNVWKPLVEKSSELSLSQLWVASRKQGKLNTIEAGWDVKGTDQIPRLFIFWTADNYNRTGCFNLLCQGFVQVNSKVLLGGSFSKISIKGSTQYELTFRVFQDPVTSNWWLRMNNIDVGYWPASLFNSLNHGSELIVFGGKVSVEKKAGDRHSKTQMGSGAFPEKGIKQAAYHREIQYLDKSGKATPALDIKYITGAPGCYHSTPVANKAWGAAFFFGGPGFNPQCK